MNITHIIHLYKAYFIEHKKRVILGSIICFVALAWGFSQYSGPEISPAVPFGFLIGIAGVFFQFSLKKNNTTHFFNLPVTAGEKLVNAIAVILTFCIIICAASLAGSYIGYYIFHPLMNPNGGHPAFINEISEEGLLFKIYLDYYRPIGLLYFAAALSTFLFGSIYFKKNAIWITAAIGLGFLMCMAFYIIALIYIAFGNIEAIGSETTIQVRNLEFITHYWIIPTAIIVFFLSLTYLRLKETEV